jgi:hypothetical protein
MSKQSVIIAAAAPVNPGEAAACLLLDHHFTVHCSGKFLSALPPNLSASEVGYRCTNRVPDRCPQKESKAQFKAFHPHDAPLRN